LSWATDAVRVVVAGQLPREDHNAPLHLFSASPELIGFGQTAYPPRSVKTSLLLGQLFERFKAEGFAMSFTVQDFLRDFWAEHAGKLPPERRRELLESLPPEERRQLLESLPPEERLAGLSPEQIRQYLDQLNAGRRAPPRKPRRKP
jgi:hypothetical protein